MSRLFHNAAKSITAVLVAVLFLYVPGAVAQLDSSALRGNERTEPDNRYQGVEVPCKEIEGSWLFTVNQLNSSSVFFNAISSFAAGGVFVATGSKDRLNPASPLSGTWDCIGRHRYNSTTYFFVFDPTHPNTEAIGTLKANQVFELKDRNKLVGAGTLSICDLAGQNCTALPNSDSQIRGSRILTEDPRQLLNELPTY